MFNLFKGGKKGRLFNNPARGGEGEKKMKKGIVFVAVIVGALVLVGWGCGQRSAAPADSNSDTNEVSETSSDNTPEVTSDTTGEVPAGWTEYRNERLGFSFQYPETWNLRVVESSPFDWSGNHYELDEVQLKEVGRDDYIGAYSFAIVANPSHLSAREWLTDNNRVGEALELSDVAVNSTLAGVRISESTQEISSPDDRAFPGTLAFSNPGKNYVFSRTLDRSTTSSRTMGQHQTRLKTRY
ncbi:hypothetical protein HZB93_03860 [Candidatus Falkowbacteria bacterium]|nr:hypothetical protein [Candidatus Falkowbacteria bacterium]